MDRMRLLAWCSIVGVVALSIAASIGLNPFLLQLIKRELVVAHTDRLNPFEPVGRFQQ